MGFWLTFFVYLGVFILGELLRPKPDLEGAKPATLGDFQFPTSTEGRAVPIIWGTVRVNGPNVGWYGDLRTEEITKKVKTGAFSSERVTIGHRYYLGLDLHICRGDLTGTDMGIRRIWIDDEILRPSSAGWVNSGNFSISDREFFGDYKEGAGGIEGTFTMYPGSAGQSIDGYLSSRVSDSTLLPAYRGTAHLVFRQVYIGNNPNLKPWSFEVRRIPNGLSLPGGQEIINEGANPMNVLYDILTNVEWGLGITNVDEVQLSSVAAILATEGNGYSRMLDNPKQAVTLIKEIEEQCDGFLRQDPITNEWQFKLIRETDYPSPLTAVPLFDESNTTSVDFSRGAWADTTNQVKLKYSDKDKDFQETFAIAHDMANKEIQNGVDVITSLNMPAVTETGLASDIAWRTLRTMSYPLAKGTIRANRANYTIRPGDLARITWPPYGLTDFFVRVNRISIGSLEQNELIIDFTEDVFRTEQPSFADNPATLWTAPDQGPADVADSRLVALPLALQTDNTKQQYAILLTRGNEVDLLATVWYQFFTSLPIPTTRTGYTSIQQVIEWVPYGQLVNPMSIAAGSPENYNTQSITIDTTTDIVKAIDQGSAVVADLNNTIWPNVLLIDNEWLFYESITDNGNGTYTLNNVHRGMFDSAPQEHAVNAAVWFVGNANSTLLEVDPLASTLGISLFVPTTSGAGSQSDPDGSPEEGVQVTLEIDQINVRERYLSPSAPIDVRADGVALGESATLPDSFRLTWNNRLSSFTDRDNTQASGNQAVPYTYNVRIYHTGVSPEVLVYNQTAIPSTGAASPALLNEHDISGYAVDPSPITSPFPSPEPFAQTYRLEIEAVDLSPEHISPKWSHDFTRA